MAERETGPRGGVTTIAPSGWQKTTIYLRKDQVRALKLAALQRDKTMSDLLRRAIDHYLLGLTEQDGRLSEHQREIFEGILRDGLALENEQIAELLATFDRISAEEKRPSQP